MVFIIVCEFFWVVVECFVCYCMLMLNEWGDGRMGSCKLWFCFFLFSIMVDDCVFLVNRNFMWKVVIVFVVFLCWVLSGV